MAVSTTRFAKSETRSFAEGERLGRSGLHEPTDWAMRNSTFFTAFVVIAVMLAIAALLVR